MFAQALKHFVLVGLVLGLAVGWALTLVVNTLLGNAIEAALHKPADQPYWGALLLTLVSMTLITVATIAGNRVFRRRIAADGLPSGSLAVSSLLYIGVVLVIVVPELSDLMNHFYTHMSHTYENPGEAWLMLSLPLLRLIGIPLSYVVAGRRSLRATPDASAPVRAAA